MRISDWSSDVCSSDLLDRQVHYGRLYSGKIEGVINQDVQAAEFLDRSGHCSLDLCFIGDVAGDADCRAPGINNLLHPAVDIRLRIGRNPAVRALTGDEFRTRAPAPPTHPRDQGWLAATSSDDTRVGPECARTCRSRGG